VPQECRIKSQAAKVKKANWLIDNTVLLTGTVERMGFFTGSGNFR
jgi:hypothetical protein